MEPLHHGEHQNQQINETFDAAIDNIKTLRFSSEFQAHCASEGIDTSADSLEYWSAASDYMQAGIDTEGDPMAAHIQTIVAATPEAILRNTVLNEGGRLKYKEARAHKQMLSHYNSLIRNFVESYPHTSASGLIANLNSTALATVADGSRHMEQVSHELTKAIVRGAQHEAAFEMLLRQCGFPYRAATIEEDLKGMDYVIEVPQLDKPIGVDVKASLSEIEAKNHHSDSSGPFAFNREGGLVIWSMVTDAELNDSFVIPKDLIEQRASVVMGAIFQAGSRQTA